MGRDKFGDIKNFSQRIISWWSRDLILQLFSSKSVRLVIHYFALFGKGGSCSLPPVAEGQHLDGYHNHKKTDFLPRGIEIQKYRWNSTFYITPVNVLPCCRHIEFMFCYFMYNIIWTKLDYRTCSTAPENLKEQLP